MFNKSLSVFKNHRGTGSNIWLLCGAFLFALIAIPGVIFGMTNARLENVRKTCQNSLNVYTITTGKEAVDSIKSGHDFTVDIKHERFLSELQKELAVKNRFKAHDKQKGRLVFSIDKINLTYEIENSLKTKLDYTVNYRFIFMGKRILSRSYDFSLESLYKTKY